MSPIENLTDAEKWRVKEFFESLPLSEKQLDQIKNVVKTTVDTSLDEFEKKIERKIDAKDERLSTIEHRLGLTETHIKTYKEEKQEKKRDRKWVVMAIFAAVPAWQWLSGKLFN